MHVTLVLDLWRDLADAARLQAALDNTGAWQVQPYTATNTDAVYTWLAQRFLSAPAHQLAALMADDDSGRYAYEAIPCHWLVGRDDVQVISTTAPTQSESEALIQAANDAMDGAARIEAVSASVWSVRARFDLTCPPFAQALGKHVQTVLPPGDAARAFKRVLNNAQMAWHAHPVNQAREARGLPAINALWLFGGKAKKAVLPLPFDAVLDTGLRSQLLAHATGAPLVTQLTSERALVWVTDARDALHHNAPLPARAYEQLAQLLRGIPKQAQIDVLLSGTGGIAHAKRAPAGNLFKRLLAGLSDTDALAAQLLK
jgi:hypothetical protein